MNNYKIKSLVWETLAVLSVLLGVFGSFGAWEAGTVSFLRMLVQIFLFGSFAFYAVRTSNLIRCRARAALRARRAAAVRRNVSETPVPLHAA